MKIRTDFVTNSSSSSFISFGIISKELVDFIHEAFGVKEEYWSSITVGSATIEGDTVSGTSKLESGAKYIFRQWGKDNRTRNQMEKDEELCNTPEVLTDYLTSLLSPVTPEQEEKIEACIKEAVKQGDTACSVYIAETDNEHSWSNVDRDDIIAEKAWKEKKKQQYRAAVALYEQGEYKKAQAKFEALGGYNDSEEQAKACERAYKEPPYQAAVALYEKGEYQEAQAAFEALGSYSDSRTQAEACRKEAQYQAATALLEAKDYMGAAKIFIVLTGYKDVDNLIATDDNLSAAAAYRAQLEVGKTATFGSYAGEGIEWLVLEVDKKANTAVLISKYGLEAEPYNGEDEGEDEDLPCDLKNEDVTWETCTLRTWLNEEFYNTAFSAAEQAKIVTTKVTADKNPDFDTDPGNDTEDKVWLLSITEANKYFANNKARRCAPTAYAVENGTHQSSRNTVNGTGACWWWLRSRGCEGYRAALVCTGGDVSTSGSDVDYGDGCVRPVVVLQLI